MKTFTLVLNEQMIAIMDRGVGSLPYREAAPFFVEVQKQINEQLQAEANNVEVLEPAKDAS